MNIYLKSALNIGRRIVDCLQYTYISKKLCLIDRNVVYNKLSKLFADFQNQQNNLLKVSCNICIYLTLTLALIICFLPPQQFKALIAFLLASCRPVQTSALTCFTTVLATAK